MTRTVFREKAGSTIRGYKSPCGKCPARKTCRARVDACPEWMGWFHAQWQGIRKAGRVR